MIETREVKEDKKKLILTPKQEKFCQCIISGMSYKDAYLTAYESNGSAQNAMNEGSKLMLREDIQERLKVLRKPLEEAAQTQQVTAREEQINDIKDRIRICKQKEDETSLIRYYDMLNKIYALYKDTEEPAKKETNVINLSTEALKKLTE